MNYIKRILITSLVAGLCLSLFAQPDKQARDVLDKTATALKQAGGIHATFVGSSQGTLLLKGDKFYFNTGEVQSWFDGKTQWSYLKSSEEVNISNPTTEELQSISPYALLTAVQRGYNCRYVGSKSRNGKQGYEVLLTPEHKQDVQSVTLFVSKAYAPLYIKVEQSNGTVSEIRVTSWQTQQPLDDRTFRFDKRQYPHAEIIDMR